MPKIKYKYEYSELIKILQDESKRLGKTPTIIDMRKIIPNADRVYKNYFETWNNAILLAGLKPTKEVNKYTVQELLDLIITKYKKLGRMPTIDDITEVNRTVYTTRFGSWNKAIEAAGLEPKNTRQPKRRKSDTFKNYTKEQMIEYLKNWAKEHDNKLPTDIISASNDIPSPTYIMNKFNVKTWKDITFLVLGNRNIQKKPTNLLKFRTSKKEKIIKEQPIKEKLILRRDSQIGSFFNFDKKEYLEKQQIKKLKRNHGIVSFKHLSKKALLILLEEEFLRLGTTSKRVFDLYKTRNVPVSTTLKKRLNISWEDMLELYFNEDGTLKEE